jgi:hypothetical protein
MFVQLAIVLAAFLMIGAPQHDHHDHQALPAKQPDSRPARAINDRCPIQGETIDTETPMRVWRGHSIGFCCPGCDKKWDAKSDADKDAFLAKYVKVMPASPAVELARRFQAARAVGDSTALDGMFLSDGKANVLQNGSDAGSWERYRDERLKPELKALGLSTWRTVTETEIPFGDATLVSQTVTITAGEGTTKRELSAAITLVVVIDAGTPKIAHMHWSALEVKPDRK